MRKKHGTANTPRNQRRHRWYWYSQKPLPLPAFTRGYVASCGVSPGPRHVMILLMAVVGLGNHTKYPSPEPAFSHLLLGFGVLVATHSSLHARCCHQVEPRRPQSSSDQPVQVGSCQLLGGWRDLPETSPTCENVGVYHIIIQALSPNSIERFIKRGMD